MVCFAVTFKPKYVAAAGLEFLITTLMVLFYILKLNKTITFFFWPLVVSEAGWQNLCDIDHAHPCNFSFFLPPGCLQLRVCSHLLVYSESDGSGQTNGCRRFIWRGQRCSSVSTVQHSLLFPELQQSIITFWLFEYICRSWVLWWSGCCAQTASCSSKTSPWTSHVAKPAIQI